ncbi:helix-turn-helix domain-containing protein [Bacillus sp. DJP31]|uniref:helix-turn-helix domain-containing protein n=1 Tax=Bacillus sp. DJP31 TaxID=3409789 RepID=UPI003BB5AADA
MKYLILVTLYGLNKIKAERSIYSLYHLFKGKRSSQTIQDAKLFQLSHLFGVVPTLERKDIERAIIRLCSQDDIQSSGENMYVLTVKGEKSLAQFHFPGSLNGWKYANSTPVFWDRLSLTTQCLSNVIRYETRFIPINRDPKTLNWVKNFLKKQPTSRDEIGELLHRELLAALKLVDERQATILVQKLTSYQRVGLTNEQIADHLAMDPLEVRVCFLSTLHHLLSLLEESQQEYPLLGQLAYQQDHQSVLTLSTQKTYELLKDGMSIIEIAENRSLKKNTIEDHIVEIALIDDHFDVSPFVHIDLFRSISECIKRENTNQLKLIKQSLLVPASYFEIRLVLAKVGVPYAT